MVSFFRIAAFVTLFSPGSSAIFWRGTWTTTSAEADSVKQGEETAILSTLLYRLESVESQVQELIGLKNQIQDLNNKIESQQELIESLETLITTRRALAAADQQCSLTFFNETGTPTCLTNYHLSAEHGLDVKGNSRFATGGKMEVFSTTLFNRSVEFKDQVKYGSNNNVTFAGEVFFLNSTEFRNTALFRDNTYFTDDVVFEDDTIFKDLVTFEDDVTFDARSIFRDYVLFNDNVEFEHGASVYFNDKVTMTDDVTIDGPSSGKKIVFEIKDRVDVRFRQRGSMTVETDSTFKGDVHVDGHMLAGSVSVGTRDDNAPVLTDIQASDLAGLSLTGPNELAAITLGGVPVSTGAPVPPPPAPAPLPNLDGATLSLAALMVGGSPVLTQASSLTSANVNSLTGVDLTVRSLTAASITSTVSMSVDDAAVLTDESPLECDCPAPAPVPDT